MGGIPKWVVLSKNIFFKKKKKHWHGWFRGTPISGNPYISKNDEFMIRLWNHWETMNELINSIPIAKWGCAVPLQVTANHGTILEPRCWSTSQAVPLQTCHKTMSISTYTVLQRKQSKLPKKTFEKKNVPNLQPPSTTINHHQPPSTTINQHQPPSTTINQHQPPSTTSNHHL